MIHHARHALQTLESQQHQQQLQADLFNVPSAPCEEAMLPSDLERALEAIDPDTLSPREALDALYTLKALTR